MQQNAKQFLESKGLKDTLYNVEDDNDTWIKGGLSKLLDEYRSQPTSEEYKLETGDGYGTTYAASQPPHGTASGGYSREDMEKAFTEGMNFDINDLPTPRVHFDNFINSLHPETK